MNVQLQPQYPDKLELMSHTEHELLHAKPTALPEMRGARVLLRELTESDVTDTYIRWMNDPDVVRYLESRYTAHTAEDLLEFVRGVKADPDSIMWAICTTDTGEHIGNIKLGPVDWIHRRGDIGIMIGEPSAWGRGYATEAIVQVSEFAFADLRLHKLMGGMYRDNVGSRRAFEKAGFELEGTRLSHFWIEDGYTDAFEMTLFREGDC